MIGFSEPIFNAMIAALAALGGLAALNGWQVRNERTQLQRYHDLALAAQLTGRDRGAFSGHSVMKNVGFLVQGGSRSGETGRQPGWRDAAWGHPAMKGLWFCLGLVIALGWIGASSADWTWTSHPPAEFWAVVVVVLLALAVVVAVVRIRRESLREERTSVERLASELAKDGFKETERFGEIPLPALAMEYPLVICQLAESAKPSSVANEEIDRRQTALTLEYSGRIVENIIQGREGPSIPSDEEIYWENWIGLVEHLAQVLPDLAWAQSLVGRAHLWHSRRWYKSSLGDRALRAARHHLERANPRHDPVAAAALARVLEIENAHDDEVDEYLDVLCGSLEMNRLWDFRYLMTAWTVPRRRDRQQRIVDTIRANVDRDEFDRGQFLLYGLSNAPWLAPSMHLLLRIERELERVVLEENSARHEADAGGHCAELRVVRAARIGPPQDPVVVPLLVTHSRWTEGQPLDGESFGVDVEQVLVDREWTEQSYERYGLAGLPFLLVVKPDYKSFGGYRNVDGTWQIDLCTDLLQSITLRDRLRGDEVFAGQVTDSDHVRV